MSWMNEAEKSMRASLTRITSDPRDEKIAALSAAIAAWPASVHEQWCAIRADCPCNCGCAEVNEARANARRVAGLED